jgi:membrane protease YdiL (CAAX protease family)
MGRILLQYALPILLPSLVYLGWLVYENRRIANGGEGKVRRWEEGPWGWLVGGGLALGVLVAIVTVVLTGRGKEGTYVPPRMEDGRVVPGHLEPARPKP